MSFISFFKLTYFDMIQFLISILMWIFLIMLSFINKSILGLPCMIYAVAITLTGNVNILDRCQLYRNRKLKKIEFKYPINMREVISVYNLFMICNVFEIGSWTIIYFFLVIFNDKNPSNIFDNIHIASIPALDYTNVFFYFALFVLNIISLFIYRKCLFKR